jgi:hypothetical protein
MLALVNLFDQARLFNYMVFLKHEENTLMTNDYYERLKKFMWKGPFGSHQRVLFYAIDENMVETKGVILILDFINPSITLCIKENSSLTKMLLDPVNIIFHVEPEYQTRCLDYYNLSEIVCFSLLYVLEEERDFATKKGMLLHYGSSKMSEIDRKVKDLFAQIENNPRNKIGTNVAEDSVDLISQVQKLTLQGPIYRNTSPVKILFRKTTEAEDDESSSNQKSVNENGLELSLQFECNS